MIVSFLDARRWLYTHAPRGGRGTGVLVAWQRHKTYSAAEYDETTWSARTWLTFAMQRISVAVHKAVAKELSDALGFSGAVDPRGAPRD